MKLNNLINILLLILLIVILILTVGMIYSVYERRLTSEKNILSKQVENAGMKIESNFRSLHEDFHFFGSSINPSDFLPGPTENFSEKIIPFKRLFSKYQDAVENIKLFDINRSLLITRDKTSYFKFTRKQNNIMLIDRHVYSPLTDTSFSLLYPLPNSKGEMTANLEMRVNIYDYIANELKGTYIGNNFCYWLIIDNKIYVINNSINKATTINPTKLDLIARDIDDGLSGVIQQKISFDKKAVTVLSSYYPVSIGESQVGLIFSIDKDDIFNPINNKIIYIFIFSFLLLIIMFFLFFRILNERKKNEEELLKAHKHSVYMLAVASEYKDMKTGEHIKRIVRMTTELAKELGVGPKLAEQMGADSVLHDLGKLGISDYILLKPGKLTDDEFETMKQHTLIGAKIIGDDEWFRQTSQIALLHHERWDGNGYPNGLKGDEIPLAARIVAVVDVFDALTSKRPYKEAWPLDKSVNEIKQGSGSQFDPRVVDAFLSIYKDL